MSTAALTGRSRSLAMVAVLALSLLIALMLTPAAGHAAPYPPIPTTPAVGTVPNPPGGGGTTPPGGGGVFPTPAVPQVVIAGLEPAAADAGQKQITGLLPGQFPVQAATGSPAPSTSGSDVGWWVIIGAGGAAMLVLAGAGVRRSRARS